MEESADLAGVGLGLVSDVTGGKASVLNVNVIDPSGSAAKSGLVMLGDTLCEVDDRDVTGMLPHQVKGLVMGPPGTSITLGLKRGSGHPFYVRLTRAHIVPSSKNSDASAGNWHAPPSDTKPFPASVDKLPSAPPPSVESGGIGVGIALDTSGQLRVTSLTPGGPADRSELIKIGDILKSVDSHNIAGRSAAAVKPYIVGPVGTPLTLVVIRGRTPITVRLVRSRAQTALPPAAAPQQQQQQQQQQPDSMVTKNDPLPTAKPANEPPASTIPQAAVVNLAEKARELIAKREAELLQIQQQQQQQQLVLQQQQQLQLQQQQQQQQPPSNDSNASIGLLLAPRHDGRLEIAGMSDGGAAQRSNMFKKGDVLTHVNGTDVQRLKIVQIKPLIVGPVGSMVSIQVERPSSGMGGSQQIVVKLKRASAMVADADRVTRTTPIPTPQETPNASPLNTQAAAAEAAAAKVAAARAAAAAAEAVASSVGSANRQQTSNAPPPTPAAAAPPSRTSEGAVCGVGLVLVPDRVGALVVSSVTEGGPAARTNLVRRGDVLKQIDGRDVYTWPMARVRPLIVGAAGSIVTLGMQRESEDTFVIVRVTRSPVRLGDITVANAPQTEASSQPVEAPVHARAPAAPATSSQLPQQQYQPPRAAAPPPVVPAKSAAPSAPPVQCGIGLVLSTIAGGSVQIRQISPGGSAQLSGALAVGDFIAGVDGKSTQGKSIEDIRPWIVGPEGSNVTLAIKRGGNQLSGNRLAQFNVTLTRKPAASAAAAAQRPLYQEQRAPA